MQNLSRKLKKQNYVDRNFMDKIKISQRLEWLGQANKNYSQKNRIYVVRQAGMEKDQQKR